MRKSLQQFKRVMLIVLLSIGIFNMVNASHIITGDITYECMGNDQYLVTFTGYFDCNGIAAPASVDIDVSSALCSNSFTHNLPMIGTPTEVSQTCPTSSTTCQGGNGFGYNRVSYSDTFSLPAQCSDWKFAYDLCCRQSSITNLINPTAENFYVEASVNNLNGICNSSVKYSSVPVLETCIGYGATFSHGAYDSDGDSLAFSIIQTPSSPSTNISYVAGYNTSNPFSTASIGGGAYAYYFNDINVNGVCGNFMFTPSVAQHAVVTVLAEEWRCINGVNTMVGSSIRDLSLVSMNCGNVAPSIRGGIYNLQNGAPTQITSSDSFNVETYVGDSLAFTLDFIDWDSSGNTTVTSNNNASMPGSIIIYSPGSISITRNVSFSWVAPLSAGHHLLTFKVEDDNCTLRGYGYHSIYVHVKDSNAAPCSQVVSVENDFRPDEALFTIYPNPTNGILMIESAYENNATVKVSNILGKKILEKELLGGINSKIDLGDNKGIYIIEIVSKERLLAKYKVINE